MANKSKEQTPEQYIKELEKQLADSRLKAELFEKVVHILKRDNGAEVKSHEGGQREKT